MENKFPYTVDVVEENDFLGTAGGLALLKDKIKETFLLLTVIRCLMLILMIS